jgi:hypothetical protein
MLNTILGARLSWHFANGWALEPAIVGPDIVDYTLKEVPHERRMPWSAISQCRLRPIIMFPSVSTVSRIRRILVGWNARRESVRAVADAMPALLKALTPTSTGWWG